MQDAEIPAVSLYEVRGKRAGKGASGKKIVVEKHFPRKVCRERIFRVFRQQERIGACICGGAPAFGGFRERRDGFVRADVFQQDEFFCPCA